MNLTKRIVCTVAAFCACLCATVPAAAISQKEFMDICLNDDAIKVAEALKDEGVSANKADAKGMTPLMMAAMAKGKAADPHKIRLLTAAGANANATNKDSMRVLMIAAQNTTNPGVIAALVRAGADMDERSAKGLTPLAFAAAYNRNPEIVNALYDLGADVNATENTGSTPFLLALRNGNSYDVLLALLEDGANPATPNSAKKTPLSFLEASKKYTPEQVASLKEAIQKKNSGPRPMSAERFAKLCSRGIEPRVRAFLTARTDPNAAFEGMTPLMYAARDNANQGVISTLLKWGAKEDARDDLGRTALIHAAQSGENPGALTELLTQGARADFRDIEGKNALDYARANPAYAGESLLLLSSIVTSVEEAEERGALIEAERHGAETYAHEDGRVTELYKKMAEDQGKILRLTETSSDLQKKFDLTARALKETQAKISGDSEQLVRLRQLVAELNETVSSLKTEKALEAAAYRDNVERLTSLWKSEMQKNLKLVEESSLDAQNLKRQNENLAARLQSAENAVNDLTSQKEEAEKRHMREKEDAEKDFQAATELLKEAHRNELDELAAKLSSAQEQENMAQQYQAVAVSQHRQEIIDLKSSHARALQESETRYEQQLTRLNAQHEKELEDSRALAERRQAEAIKASAEQLNRSHNDELLREKSRHAMELVSAEQRLTEDFEKRIADLTARKDDELRAKSDAYESEIAALKGQFAENIDVLKQTLQQERDANAKLSSELDEMKAQNEKRTAELTEQLKTQEALAQAELRQRLSEQENTLKAAFEVEKARLETEHRQELLDTVSDLENRHSGAVSRMKDDHRQEMDAAVSQMQKMFDEAREQAQRELSEVRAAVDRQNESQRESDTVAASEVLKQGRREARQLLESAYAQSLRQAEIRYDKLLRENQLKQKNEYDAAVEVLNTKHRQELEEAAVKADAARRDALAAQRADDERHSAEELAQREREWSEREKELNSRQAQEIERLRAVFVKSSEETAAALKREYETRVNALLAQKDAQHAAEMQKLEAIQKASMRSLEERYERQNDRIQPADGD